MVLVPCHPCQFYKGIDSIHFVLCEWVGMPEPRLQELVADGELEYHPKTKDTPLKSIRLPKAVDLQAIIAKAKGCDA